jgi:PAS domain S-box-containing protein
LDHRAFLESTPLAPWEGDAETGRVTFVGHQALDLLGYPLSDWHRPDFWDAKIYPDDQSGVSQARAKLARRGGAHVIEFRMERADGRIIWVSEAAGVGKRSDGHRSVRALLTDITDRKRLELSLWKSEEKLRALLRWAPDAMILTDDRGIILNMNRQAEALVKYELREVVGSSIDYLAPDRLRSRLPELRAAFERDPHRLSLVDGHGLALVRSDGAEVPVELSMSLLVDVDESRQILCSVRDLTARRRVEAQLRSSEERLREIANVLPAMVCFVDLEQRLRFVNDSYARWHGWERGRMEGVPIRSVVGDKLYAGFGSALDAALEGKPSHFRGEMADASGAARPFDVTLVPQHGEDGAVAGCSMVIFDVTDEVAAQEANRRHLSDLAHVARVATMGELTASIAHELNQPLSAIVSNAQAAAHFLDRDEPVIEEAREALADIAADGQRAGEVIARMRQLLKRGETREEPVDVPSLVGNVVDLLRSEAIGRGVELSTHGAPDARRMLPADSIQLKQVFLNIIMNAIESVSEADRDPRRVRVTTVLDGNAVEVAVADTGVGLPDDAEDIFDPFVSSKADGLGMGLTISRTIVDAHGGRIWAEPGHPVGAVFRIRLPLA